MLYKLQTLHHCSLCYIWGTKNLKTHIQFQTPTLAQLISLTQMLLSALSLVQTSQLSFCLLLPCWPEEKHSELKWDRTRNSEQQHPIAASPSRSQQTHFCFIFNYFPLRLTKLSLSTITLVRVRALSTLMKGFWVHQTCHSDNSIFTSRWSTSPCSKLWNTQEPQPAPLGELQARGAAPGAAPRHTPASRAGGPHSVPLHPRRRRPPRSPSPASPRRGRRAPSPAGTPAPGAPRTQRKVGLNFLRAVCRPTLPCPGRTASSSQPPSRGRGAEHEHGSAPPGRG